MCGIFGFINYENATQKVIDAMNKISYRGQDSRGIYDYRNISYENNIKPTSSKIAIGHLLLSIVDFTPQPIKSKGILIANCEIYNWQELASKYNLSVKSDSQLLLELLDKFGIKILDELDGPYAFAYLKDDKLTLARDILGVKPLFINQAKDKLCFASEKKVLPKESIELNPRTILTYNLKTKELQTQQRKFYELTKENTQHYPQTKKDVEELLIKAIKKRIPKNQKVGVLFSGGIDSTIIAYLLKKYNIDFTCYTAKVNGGNIKEASDLIYAKEIAQKYNFNLKIAQTTTQELEPIIQKVIELIEDRDYIKVSVALPFYLASQQAKKDKVKVIFSGLGSEEIFAGYRRHKKAKDANKECLEGLKILHTRDLYRDDVITMANNIEMRCPFLDKNLINYSLQIPVKYKISKDKIRSKIILRDVSKDLGLNEKYAERQKKAAQYGSKFDKGILRLAKDNNLSKQDYLNSLNVPQVPLCEFKGDLE